MPLPPRITPTKQQTRDRNVNDAQTQAARTGQALNNFPLQPGRLVPNQRFVVGTNTYVQHGLGRVPIGYILCNIRTDPTQAGATAAQGCQRNTTADPTNDETKFLSLGPFQPFLADVWIY